jgi:PPK2 family polyphosphate:nucleotide phosphotransferase
MLELRVKDFTFKSKKHFKLVRWKSGETFGYPEESEKGASKELLKTLENLQMLLYAQHKNKILIVLQGIDTAGKDGTVKHVFRGLNPQGVRVESFKVPTPEELDHDYLWRVHKKTPAKGEIVIFNRSHYEDVLVTRVHKLIDKKEVKRRFRQICDFEKMLTEEGTLVLKFFLHISKEEQKKRLEARLDNPDKGWKFDKGDIVERKSWNLYQEAYADVMNETNSKYAPWYIIPSDHKWFRNLAVATILVEQLKSLKMKYPNLEKKPKKIK